MNDAFFVPNNQLSIWLCGFDTQELHLSGDFPNRKASHDHRHDANNNLQVTLLSCGWQKRKRAWRTRHPRTWESTNPDRGSLLL